MSLCQYGTQIDQSDSFTSLHSVRVLHCQYSAYALRKSALTPPKSVVGTIVKREVCLFIVPNTDLYSVRTNCAVRTRSIDGVKPTLDPICFPYSYRPFSCDNHFLCTLKSAHAHYETQKEFGMLLRDCKITKNAVIESAAGSTLGKITLPNLHALQGSSCSFNNVHVSLKLSDLLVYYRYL